VTNNTVTVDRWCDADFIGRSVSQENARHCALNGIPVWGGPFKDAIAPPSYYHTGYRVKLTDEHRVNNPWRHVYQTVRGNQMITLNGRWRKMAAGSLMHIQLIAYMNEVTNANA